MYSLDSSMTMVSLVLMIWCTTTTTLVSACTVINSQGVDITASLLSSAATTTSAIQNNTTEPLLDENGEICNRKCQHARNKQQQQQASSSSSGVVVVCPGDDNGWAKSSKELPCYNATISNCPKVTCNGLESCYLATMINITNRVDCQGRHSCHRSTIYMSKLEQQQEQEEEQTVTCQGAESCDVAEISTFGDDDLIFDTTTTTIKKEYTNRLFVKCLGEESCRKTQIKADTVECLEGNEVKTACTTYATFLANCVICGIRGCVTHPNECRMVEWNTILQDTSSTTTTTPIIISNAEEEFQYLIHHATPCVANTMIGSQCDTAKWTQILQQQQEEEHPDKEEEGNK